MFFSRCRIFLIITESQSIYIQVDNMTDDDVEWLDTAIQNTVNDHGANKLDTLNYRYITLYAKIENGGFY